MSINLPLMKLRLAVQPSDGFVGAPLVAGIVEYGFGLSFDAEATVRIRESFDAEAAAEILAEDPQPPLNPLAVHIGQGALLAQWDAPLTGTKIDHYEVWAALSENGSYQQLTDADTEDTTTVIHNMPIGSTLYFKVRSVSPGGKKSSFTQAKLGVLSRPSLNVDATCVEGSTIPSGSIFTAKDSNGRLVAIQADAQIDF